MVDLDFQVEGASGHSVVRISRAQGDRRARSRRRPARPIFGSLPERGSPVLTDFPDRLSAALGDRYRLERELGQGGMATVYLAEDLKHHRRVAIKVLRSELAQALGAGRFLREIEIAAGLTHPHILPVHDSGQAGGFLYYVMPYVEGESLRQKLAREGALPVPEASRLLREVVDALAKAHRAGIVHRDIKPENVLLADGHALVSDFGVAKAVREAGGDGTLTMAGMAVGTPAYMAPEQAAGDTHVDARADLYAVGVVAYELLTGRPPFTGATPQQVLAAQVTTPPEPITKYRPGVPPPLADLVMRCLAKHPADRPQTAEQLVPVLESAATPGGGTATLTGVGIGAVPSTDRRRLAVKLGVVAVLVAAAAYALARRPGDGAGGSGANAGGAASGMARSVAVLPFTNLSGDTANEYFSDGISEEILNAVGQLPGVLVAARSSAFAFKGQDVAVSEVARRLNVAHVLEGSVQRAGNRIRITAQLVDASTGYQRWSGKYDRDATDIFAVEDEISRAIAGALRVELAGGAATGPSAGETQDPEAHDLYLLGLHYLNARAGEQDLRTAIEYFGKAAARDSTYARAYAGQASAYLLLPEYARTATPDAVPSGRRAAARALALDSTLAAAHLAHGYLLKSYDWDWAGAEREYRAAIALDPNLATAHQWLAELMIDRRRMAEARSELDTALRLDPAAGIVRLVEGQYYSSLGNLDSAAAAFQRARDLTPAFVPAFFEGAMTAIAAGRYDRARDLFRGGAAAAGLPEAPLLAFLTGVEHPAERPAAVRAVEALAAGQVFPAVVQARFYTLLGDTGRALDLLERAVAEHAAFTTYIGRWSEFRRLDAEPRYRAVLRRIGLPEPAAGGGNR